MDANAKRLTGMPLTEFLGALGIAKVEPVSRTSASGERANEDQLQELLKKGDPLRPGPGRVAEDAATLTTLFEQADEGACFGLTPDGHLTNHQPIPFDAEKAAAQVMQLWEVDMAADDKEEALAATWLALAYHDHDHPADFGGLVRTARDDGGPRCCYVDVKGTMALSPGAQRTKLEQRAQERKFGCLAQTVTSADANGFANYPGYGKPGLLVTLLHNPVVGAKSHAGYAMNWFFGISSNYQAAAAVWGWGGRLGVKLPAELLDQLAAAETTLGGQTKSLLDLLGDYRDYSQFRDANGEWDRPSLRSTLHAMFLAARYLLMHEDEVQHAQTTVHHLQPDRVETPLSPEDFHPGESLAAYFGRRADENKRTADDALRRLRKEEEDRHHTELELRESEEKRRKQDEELRKKDEDLRKKDEDLRKKDEEQRKAEEERRKSEDSNRRMVVRLRQRGHSEAEIAEDLNCTVEELQQRFPPQP